MSRGDGDQRALVNTREALKKCRSKVEALMRAHGIESPEELGSVEDDRLDTGRRILIRIRLIEASIETLEGRDEIAGIRSAAADALLHAVELAGEFGNLTFHMMERPFESWVAAKAAAARGGEARARRNADRDAAIRREWEVRRARAPASTSDKEVMRKIGEVYGLGYSRTREIIIGDRHSGGKNSFGTRGTPNSD